MDRLGQTELEHLGLKPPLQEVRLLESKHIIQLRLRLIQNPKANESAEHSMGKHSRKKEKRGQLVPSFAEHTHVRLRDRICFENGC